MLTPTLGTRYYSYFCIPDFQESRTSTLFFFSSWLRHVWHTAFKKCLFNISDFVSLCDFYIELLINQGRTSLVAQWLRIRLPMQGTRVRALVRKDPTCRGATKPVRHNYWACTLEPASHNYWSPCATTTEARAPKARARQQEKPPHWEVRAPQRRPNTAKNK